jgi:hypothetical protein
MNIPPKWCKNAIPTKYGWADPKTGELLVCVRHLENPIEGYAKNRPIKVQPITAIVKPVVKQTKVSTKPATKVAAKPATKSKPVRKRASPKKVQPRATKLKQSTENTK